jgi:hypothetical protein
VLKWSNETSSLAALVSLTANLIESCVNVVAASGVHWGDRSALIAILMHFLKLEHELELFGSEYNADLPKGQLKPFGPGRARL